MKIEKRKYQGYIWYSNANEPELLLGNEEWECELDEQANPFIVEGQLWDEDSRTSKSIKYVDDQYIVKSYQLENAYDLVEFMPHKMPGVSRLLFARCWKPTIDKNCCDLETQVLDRIIFKGFKMQEDRV